MKFADLTTAEAEKRLSEQGENTFGKQRKKSKIAAFFGQYKDIMTLILLACTVISFFMGEYAEAIAITVIVLLNGILGFWQEYRTERTLQSLRDLSAPQANVFRDKKAQKIDAAKIVRGDLLIVNAGDKIPADALLLDGVSVESDESLLTGESLPAVKNTAPDLPVSNKLNDPRLLYAGCTVTKGHGLARVIDTATDTQMGKIAHLLTHTEKDESPLSKKLDRMGKIIAIGCILVCAAVTLCGTLRGEDLLDMLLTGVSLAVAAVPEGLAAIVTISLAISVSRMKNHNALVRHLHAVETLGCASVICTDKTGTLTENRMTVQQIYTCYKGIENADKCLLSADTKLLFHAASSCCKEDFAADPTETAIKTCCKKNAPGDKPASIQKELPFDSTRKRMSVLTRDNGKAVQYTKGAPDYLLPLCTRIYQNGSVQPMSHTMRAQIKNTLEQFGNDALRCICVAYREGNDITEDNLIFLGLFGMLDPPRKGVRQAVSECRNAGIKVCMVTGDHAATASKIAKDIGILRSGDKLMTGEELEQIPNAALADQIGSVSVFCRVSPTHKLKIINALRKKGAICAMTGDGVNDAPALRQADIGVSMGKNGTDVAREASDIVLLDDDFTTLTAAVRCGRGVYDNIRKFLRYLLSCNIGEVLTMFLGLLLKLPVVLLPLQILLVNLVTDGLPAIALSLEPVENDVMQQKPRPLSESIFSHGLGVKIILRGILIGISTLASFLFVMRQSNDLTMARTAALFTLVAAQLIHVFECKSETRGLFSVHYGNNKALLGAVLLSFLVLLGAIYIPATATLFGLCALPGSMMLTALLCAAAVPVVSSLLRIKFTR